MKNFYNVIFLLSLSVAFGQAPTISWLKNYGGSSSEFAQKTIPTSDGGYMVCGGTYSADGDISTNQGEIDIWLIKLDASGNLIWQKTYGGTKRDLATSIIEIVGEGYVISGYTNSNNGDISGNHGGYDMWMFKVDTSGNMLWQKVYGGTLDEYINNVTTTPDGGFIIAGSSESNNGDFTLNQGLLDMCLIKVDNMGNLVWQKTYGGSSYEQALNIKPTLDGNYIISGYTRSTDGDVSTTVNGNSDYWILKIDDSGNILWDKTYGGLATENAYGITTTPDGGYIAVGDTQSSGGDVSNPLGGFDFWVIKIDGTGALVWEKTFGGSGYDWGKDIIQDFNGGYILTGYTRSTNGDVTVSLGGYDIWVLKIDDSGNLIWQKSFGGTLDDYCYSITALPDNNYIIGGDTKSSDGDMVSISGIFELWIAKLNNNSLSINDFTDSSIAIYPNPANDVLYVQSKELVSVGFYNMLGQKVFSKTIDNINPINVSQLKEGMYTVFLETESGKSTSKKIIIRK